MKQLIIAGVRRGSIYSPNHIGNDAAVFEATVNELRASGCIVNEYTEDEFKKKDIPEKIIFNMARNFETISKLQQLEDAGYLVINSGYGIQNCMREQMTNLLIQNNIPHPESIVVDTDKDATDRLTALNTTNFWLKRADCHAIHREDVAYAGNIEIALNLLEEFHLRGINRAVINKHLKGDLLKFYGIYGSEFFYWFYPGDENHSKFGHESINGYAHKFVFSQDYLKEICEKSAKTLNIKIYGGDCIVNREGDIQIIDFNDWPSFAPCRNEAAPHIAQCIFNEAMKQSMPKTNVIF